MKGLDREVLEGLFNGMRDSVIFIDSRNRFAFLNRAAEQIVGMNAGEAVGKSILTCHPPGMGKKVLQVIKNIQNGKVEFHHSIRSLRGRYYDNVFTKVITRLGKYSGILLVQRDITEKLKLQKVLEESNKEMRLLQQINDVLNSTMATDEVLRMIVKGITSAFGYEYCAVHLLSADRTCLICKGYSADSKVVKKIEKLTGYTALNYRIPLPPNSPISKIIEDKKVLFTYDIVGLIRNHTEVKILQRLAPVIAKITGVMSGIGVPLLTGDEVVGSIGIGSRGKMTEQDVVRLKNFARQAGLAVEKARLYGVIREKSSELQMVIGEIRPSAPLRGSRISIDSDAVLKAISHKIRGGIIRMLNIQEKARFTDIKLWLKIKDATKLSFHLRELKSATLVEQDDKKRYFLSPKGKRAALSMEYLEKDSAKK